MLTVIIKRTEEPNVIRLTQENIMKELAQIPGSEMLLEDSWGQGLRKVRTQYVCLVEPDCTLSANYLTSNYGLMQKSINYINGGGNTRLAMLASCIGVERFDNRIYHYRVEQREEKGQHISVKSWQPEPIRNKNHTKLYNAQIGFVPGAIIRYASLKESIDLFDWEEKDLVKLSTDISFYFWNTNRRISINPNTTYVSTQQTLNNSPGISLHIPDKAANVFRELGI